MAVKIVKRARKHVSLRGTDHWDYVAPQIENALQRGQTRNLINYLNGYMKPKDTQVAVLRHVHRMAVANDFAGLERVLTTEV